MKAKRRSLLLSAGLGLSIGLSGSTMTGCTRDGVITQIDGGYRKAYQDQRGQWYYVDKGKKIILPGPPPEYDPGPPRYTKTGDAITEQERQLLEEP